MSWTPMFVDEKGWGDIRGILETALKDVMSVQAECVKRTAKSGEEGFNVSVAMLGYEVPEEAAKKPLKKKAGTSKSKGKGKAKRKS